MHIRDVVLETLNIIGHNIMYTYKNLIGNIHIY